MKKHKMIDDGRFVEAFYRRAFRGKKVYGWIFFKYKINSKNIIKEEEKYVRLMFMMMKNILINIASRVFSTTFTQNECHRVVGNG